MLAISLLPTAAANPSAFGWTAPIRFDGGEPIGFGSGDLNGDGHPDAVVAHFGAPLQVLLSGGTTPAPAADRNVAGAILRIGDVTGDGLADLVTASRAVFLVPGDGAGGFGAPSSPSLSPNPTSIENLFLRDVDSDGDLDVLVSERRFSAYYWRTCTSDGSALNCAWPQQASGAVQALADFDGNGHQDMLTRAFDQLYLHAAAADGTLDPSSGFGNVLIFAGYDAQLPAPVVGDADGDGDLDIVILLKTGTSPNWTYQLTLLENDGAGDFTPAAVADLSAPYQSVLGEDVNGDGLLDLVVRGRGIEIFLGKPDGFTGSSWSDVGFTPALIDDVTGDGMADAVGVAGGGWAILSGTQTPETLVSLSGTSRANAGDQQERLEQLLLNLPFGIDTLRDITRTVDGIRVGSAATGYFLSAGFYRPPAEVPPAGTVTLALSAAGQTASHHIAVTDFRWEPLALDGVDVRGLAASEPGVWYAWTESELFRSTDDARTWTTVAGAPSQLRRLAVDPANPLRLAAAVQMSTYDWRIQQSRDGGATWTDVTPHVPFGLPGVASLEFDGRGRLYLDRFRVGIGEPLTWSTLPSGILLDPFDADGLWAFRPGEVSRLRWDGATLVVGAPQPSTGLVIPHRGMVADPHRQGHVWATGGHGVVQTADGGRTWLPLREQPSFPPARTSSMVPDPSAPDRWLLAASALSTIRQTDDGGASFWNATTGLPRSAGFFRIAWWAIVADPDTPGRFLAATEVGLFSNLVNRPPLAEAGGPYEVVEGSEVALDATGSSDPDGDPLSYEWAPADHLDDPTLSGPVFRGIDDTEVALELTVTDDGGLSATDQTTVTVANAPPVVAEVTSPVDPQAVGTLVTVEVPYTDPGVEDTHTATWDWGDGTVDTTAPISTGGAGIAMAGHAYVAPGVYPVAITVSDDDGGSAAAVSDLIIVYDPEGGFVTGGGWFDSSAGAYFPDPDLSGRASFGFVSKYHKGAQLPTGNTEFVFKAGGLNFHSAGYDWLVVNQGGTNAQFKGTGTINGAPAPSGQPYRFMIWAGDGDPDTFRIKLWWEDAGEQTVYDNRFGQPLGGGSIVIHAR